MNMDIKEIYQIAKNLLESFTNRECLDFRLEQAEFNKDDKIWEIVVSYLVENINKASNTFSVLGIKEFPFERIYKKVKINENKEVLGFYIFEK